MKKLLSVLLLAILILCSCSNNSESLDDSAMIKINYDLISRRNNRQTLMNKYDFISENVYYYNLDTKEYVPNWSIDYYKQQNGNINAQFFFGDEFYFYYNNNIFLSYSEQEPYFIITFKTNYDKTIKERLKRENTLNYVFYDQTEGYKTDTGFFASYMFTLTKDVLNDFRYWNVHVGETLKVDYNLNENYEILDYAYYIVNTSPNGEVTYKEIMSSKTVFNKEFTFPDFIYEADKSEKHTLTIKENYLKSSEITETYQVPHNFRIWGDYNLVKSKIYKDEDMSQKWILEEDRITENLVLYTIPYTEETILYYYSEVPPVTEEEETN
jgi:hypothetical protein